MLDCPTLSHRTRGDRQSNQGDILYPVGYSDKAVPDTSVQETDRNLVEKVRPTHSQPHFHSTIHCLICTHTHTDTHKLSHTQPHVSNTVSYPICHSGNKTTKEAVQEGQRHNCFFRLKSVQFGLLNKPLFLYFCITDDDSAVNNKNVNNKRLK